MNSIRYMAHHNPQPTPPNDAENRRLCWQARHAETADERLAARNELLIRRAARRLAARSILPFDDLVSEGQLGLIAAIREFRFDRDTPFGAYAKVAVRRWIQRAVLEQGGIINIRNLQWSARGSARKLADLDRARSVLSIDAPFGERSRLGDAVPAPMPDVDLCETRDTISFALERLTSREQVIVSLYFGLGGEPPLRDDDIAGHIGLCREAVRINRHRAMGRIARILARKGVAG